MLATRMRMGGGHDGTLYGILQFLGLSRNLVLDAGDSASYTSGQKWLDRSSGGYDFMLGSETGSPSTGDEPTFNGTPGSLSSSEYWSFGGNDYFRYDTTNETWMDARHKNNALFTDILIYYPVASLGAQGLMGTIRDGSNAPGAKLFLTSAEKLTINVKNGSGDALLKTADTATTTGAWHFIALVMDEAGGSGFFYEDGGYKQVGSSDTFTSTYSSPSASAATDTMEIGAIGNASIPVVNGSRIACVASLPVALSKAQLDAVYAEIGPRFGLS